MPETEIDRTRYDEDDFTEETVEEAEAREAAATRATLVANLRAYATLLEEFPALPAPDGVYLAAYCDAATARAGRRGIPGWKKHNSPSAYYVQYAKTIGTGEDYRSDITLTLEVSKQDTCTRVQTGVEHVAAVEAHDRPIYKWNCQSGPGNDEADE